MGKTRLGGKLSKNRGHNKLRIAIFHDYFNKRGGGEKVVLELAKHFDADIYTGFVVPEDTFEDIQKLSVYQLSQRNDGSLRRAMSLLLTFRKFKTPRHYDMYIFSGTACIHAAKNHHPNIWYCHTPARHLYSQYAWFKSILPAWQRPLFSALACVWRPIDRKATRGVQTIVANSNNVKNRILKYYGRESTVIYPPIDTSHIVAGPSKNYYLSYGRIDRLKRIDIIVKAFKQMPDKKLIVASGGPELETIKLLASGSPNITVLGYVSDEKLKNLLAHCIATIYIPVDEDFGMTPLEGMAAGKPCIGVDDGGLKETIIHKKNGYLCPKKIKANHIISAAKWLTIEKSNKMRANCITQSKRFTTTKFIHEFENIIRHKVR